MCTCKEKKIWRACLPGALLYTAAPMTPSSLNSVTGMPLCPTHRASWSYHHFVGKERENYFGIAQGVFDDTAVNGHEMDRIRWRKAPWPTVCKKVVLVKAVRLFGAASRPRGRGLHQSSISNYNIWPMSGWPCAFAGDCSPTIRLQMTPTRSKRPSSTSVRMHPGQGVCVA